MCGKRASIMAAIPSRLPALPTGWRMTISSQLDRPADRKPRTLPGVLTGPIDRKRTNRGEVKADFPKSNSAN
jgi:hypothetical protein